MSPLSQSMSGTSQKVARKTLRILFTTIPILVVICSASISAASVNGMQSQVPVAAKADWNELVALDSRQNSRSAVGKGTIPLMSLPKGGEILPESPVAPPDALNVPGEMGFDAAATTPTLLLSFLALPDPGNVIPPDTHGAVGLNHVMTMLNSQVRIHSRTGSTISTVSLASFWAPAGGSGVFDPRLIYDPASGRWMATCDSDRRSAASSALFAISATGDPTGSWTFYKIDADATNINWADFPDIGYNNTWIAITNNMFAVSNDAFGGTAMWVIDKSTALAGGTLTMTTFPVGFDNVGGAWGATLRVCQSFGSPAKLYIVDNAGFTTGGTHMLRLSEITGTAALPVWSATAGSVFSGSGLFSVNTNFNGTQIDAAQLGTSIRIETNDDRLLNAVYRNGRIYTTHSAGLPVAASNRTSVFWYELNPTALPSPIVQSGVIDGGTDVHHFFPSITANTNGDIVVGFTRSDATRFAEAVFAGRLASDVAGTMGPITVLKAGEDSYVKDFGGDRVRWGDYSATVVDPVNDSTFWTIQEYSAFDVGPTPNNDRWGTWWGKASFTPPGDVDGDGVPDATDNCPFTPNPGQTDSDGDGAGDACDICPGFNDALDSDADGVPDGCDVCPGFDDAIDSDGDTVPDGCDICQGADDFLDSDLDGVPDGCDICPGFNDANDSDVDGVPDGCDICPGFNDANDTDLDGVPDGCDICPGFDDANDSDLDGVPDGCDICPGFDDAIDTDLDGVPDGCDICPGFNDANDSDLDGVPDGCDICPGFNDANDSDLDGVPDGCDICPGFNDAIDTDLDGVPDGCDVCPGFDDANDSDLDGVPDGCDICPGFDDANDTDLDGVPDGCDVCPGFDDGVDFDLDGVPDGCDNCPLLPNPGQEDSDGDGIGDVCCCVGATGNIDGDPADIVDIADLTFLIDHLFISFPPLACHKEGNVDGDPAGIVDIADLTFLIDHLFINFPPTAPCQ